MAEKKYDLLLINTTNKNHTIQHQPWYKERLKTKYLKPLKSKIPSKSLNWKNKFLLKNGVDDFRDGLPLITDGSYLSQPKSLAKLKEEVPKYQRFTKEQICYSKKFPLAEERWNKLQLLEYTLLQHPLALFPHLELCVDKKVFLDIVKLLDPEMYNPQSPEEMDTSTKDVTEMKIINQFASNIIQPNLNENAANHQMEGQKKQLENKSSFANSVPVANSNNDGETLRNPYRWLTTKNEDKNKEQKKGDRISDAHNDHVKNVIQEFCEWVSSLGGDNSIDESTINALFSNDYENKPTLSVPIEIVDISQGTHHNLDVSDKVYQNHKPIQNKTLKQRPAAKPSTLPPLPHKNSKNHTEQVSPFPTKRPVFGAWYLPVKAWKKEDNENQLEDSKELPSEELSERKKLSISLAFLDWINNRGYRKPEFLKEITLLQQKTKLKNEEQNVEREKSLNSKTIQM
ncbi:uncharacterized protein LOC106871430 isoform X2 [Octopus bimaculoides]|uniref:Protein FAM47E n=1 Tax=Octopus bimaculoides TaxID=37653 RepID=A0A0L8HDF5_OCTBM|nr:uncharacterized protein LOC106871430 isoform X2 [Octopus bimaculoides]|eukprot:XP_014773367.1 PREDICTED: uncharacterized protein LOC106871430 isoform X2 [Octopus bimaculoides]